MPYINLVSCYNGPMKKLSYFLGLALIFVVSVVLSKDLMFNTQVAGPIFGLLTVVMVYFISKVVAQAKSK